ncbi:MAG: bifunctional folylpolyglutamate synthase/dihydrofolate synthase [Alicyclobacillaceae bacterium]|nr:bifunctional folylpolyglutamate synthase/dihydrofolate synthase [Alicyclobacillaceae bacterium]
MKPTGAGEHQGPQDPERAWLSSRQRFGIRPGLERTRRVLAALGHPERDLVFFHVAGTNGKGSVCAFLTALLGRSMRVGTFTSPAFDGYRGRFAVAGELISDSRFRELVREVRVVSERVTPDDPLTEFEVLTVMAILHFAAEKVDAVVWETGLGGRYDSTNVVAPLVTGITNVSYDHADVLGRTLTAIAWQKAGIIKPGVPVITATTDDAYVVVERTARDHAAPLWVHRRTFAGIRERLAARMQWMTYRGRCRDAYGLPVPLWGEHQCENAAVALAMLEAAVERGFGRWPDDGPLREAMASVQWPGRFEVFEVGHGVVVLDGAHNPDAARRLKMALTEFSRAQGWPERGWTMVVGALRDKDVLPMLRTVLPLAGRVVATQPASSRALAAADMGKLVQAVRDDIPVDVANTVEEAIGWAVGGAGAEIQRPVCCWGSLYTVDEARKAMTERLTRAENWGR